MFRFRVSEIRFRGFLCRAWGERVRVLKLSIGFACLHAFAESSAKPCP